MKLNPAEKNAYDALVYLTQTVRLPITAMSVKKQLYLHPDFPSLLAMSDVLTEWKVPNIASRVSKDQLVDIPLPAMAYLDLYGGYFAPIRRVKNEQVEWLDTNRGWQTDSLADFSRKWNNIVLLMEPNEYSGETNYRQKKREELLTDSRVPGICIGFLVCLFCIRTLFLPDAVLTDRTVMGLLLAKLAGIMVTTLLLWHTIDADNSLLRTLCGLDSRTNCNSVLTSKAAKLWGWLSWSEIGFVYFAGSILAMLIGLSTGQSAVLSWLVVLNALALPYTVYSVYYQYRIAKSWCTLCLLVQALFWVEFTLGVAHWQSIVLTIDLQTVSLFGLAFTLPVLLWVLLKKPLQQAIQIFPLRRELQKAKFNPEYVESLFSKQPQMPPIFESMRVIKIGNEQAEHTLTVVTNPLCGPCRRLHSELEVLIEHTDTINCQFVFVGSAASVPVIQKLLGLHPADAVRAMHQWYRQNDRDNIEWCKDIDHPAKHTDVEQQGQLHARWSELAQVTSTPTLYLNGRQLPLSYMLSDVENLCRILPMAPQRMESVDSNKSIV